MSDYYYMLGKMCCIGKLHIVSLCVSCTTNGRCKTNFIFCLECLDDPFVHLFFFLLNMKTEFSDSCLNLLNT